MHNLAAVLVTWGLRDYGIEPRVWDADPDCEHEWGDENVVSTGRNDSGEKRENFHGQTDGYGGKREASQGQFCQKCSAWRGSLGLESSPELYIFHMVQIFREVRRVLRDDGTVWLNLGSSYASGGTSPNQSHSDALSCDKNDKEPQGLMENGRACLCSGDESQGGCLSHHHCIFHNDQQNPQCALRSWLKDHDTGSRDSVSAFLDALHSFFQESTSLSSFENVQGASGPLTKALVSLLQLCSYSPGFQESSHTLVCISDIFRKLLPSACHIRDTVFSFLAYQLPLNGLIMDSLTNISHNVKYKPKDLINIPHLVSEALRQDGWYLRSDIIWNKPNPMPESVTDRPTKSHEYIFLLTKSAKYFYDADAIKESSCYPDGPNSPQSIKSPYGQGFTRRSGNKERKENHNPAANFGVSIPWEGSNRNKRTVWTVATQPFPGQFCTACKAYYPKGWTGLAKHTDENDDEHAICRCGKWDKWLSHFATFGEKLIEPCLLAGTSEKGCCPECGAPWVRVTEKRVPELRDARSRYPGEHTLATKKYQHGDPGPESETIGWKPICECVSWQQDRYSNGSYARSVTEHIPKSIPCTVLDPFFGSGTVGLLCEKYNRKWIGIELSEDYSEMAKKRIEDATRQRKLF